MPGWSAELPNSAANLPEIPAVFTQTPVIPPLTVIALPGYTLLTRLNIGFSNLSDDDLADEAAAISAARAPLAALLQTLGQNLASTPGATVATLATSGYKLPKQGTRTTTTPPASG